MMFVWPLFLGFVTSLIALSIPGMLNMTAAKVGIEEGRTRAFVFAGGATLIILIQTLIAVVFARFIDRNPDVVILLREIGLAIFAVLTFYFFWTPKKMKPRESKDKLKSKRSRFFLGMLLSALNLFPIPFYVFVSVTLSTYDTFSFEKSFVYPFVAGSALGAFFAFYCYIAFFKKMEQKTAFLLNNMNYIIGTATGLVCILTLLNVIKYYWG